MAAMAAMFESTLDLKKVILLTDWCLRLDMDPALRRNLEAAAQHQMSQYFIEDDEEEEEEDDDDDNDDIPDMDHGAYFHTTERHSQHAYQGDDEENWDDLEDDESAAVPAAAASATTSSAPVAILAQISSQGSELNRIVSAGQHAIVDSFLGRLMMDKEKLKHLGLVS